MHPKSVAKLLNTENNTLQGLLNHLKTRNELLARIQALIPESLRDHCLGATRNQQQITLFVDSPAWGAKLRYLKKDLLMALNQRQTTPLKDIVVRILPTQRRFQKTTKRALQPSGNGANTVQQTADSIRDPDLKKAMQRLAARLLSN